MRRINRALGYSAVNTARSALSSKMVTSDSGLTFRGNPFVKRLLRGIFNIRPSIPKYVCVHDVILYCVI